MMNKFKILLVFNLIINKIFLLFQFVLCELCLIDHRCYDSMNKTLS